MSPHPASENPAHIAPVLLSQHVYTDFLNIEQVSQTQFHLLTVLGKENSLNTNIDKLHYIPTITIPIKKHYISIKKYKKQDSMFEGLEKPYRNFSKPSNNIRFYFLFYC